MALAQIAEIERLKLVERSAELGALLLEKLRTLASPELPLKPAGPATPPLELRARGLGLMAGVELRHADGSPATAEAIVALKELLKRGYIFLPEGEHSNIISFTPPMTISEGQLAEAVSELGKVLTTDRHG